MKGTEIVLYGTVGQSFWDEQHFTAKEVREQLASASGPVTVRLNSGGGVASEGQAIYSMLAEYPGDVTVIVEGVAASAASLIAMAGDKIVMREGAWMLIHDPAQPWSVNRGTEDDHIKTAQTLAKIANGYARVYARKSGKTPAECREIMKVETMYEAAEAVAAGFATETDSEAAVAAAAFDYRIYAHAPQVLRDASEKLGAAPVQEAVMAIFAGTNRATPKEFIMSDDTKAAEQTPAAKKDDAPVMVAPKTEAPAAVLAAERERSSRIMALAASHGMPEMAAALIADGTPLALAVDKIIEARAKAVGDEHSRPATQPARILRDERDTRMTGMTMALESQLARKDPASDVAHPYMDMGIISMAMEVTGSKRAPRDAAGREDVVRMAMHTTSDFPIILENALNKRLADSYNKATPTYRTIADRMDFTDFRAHPISQVGDMPALLPVAETGEIKFGTVGEKKESVTLAAYGVGLSISRQLIVNDDLNAIERVLAGRGTAVALWEDATFWASFLSGSNADGATLTETSRQVFNTTDLTKAGTNAAITVASLAIGRANMRKMRGIAPATGGTGQLLNVTPAILLVGPDKETEAQQLLAPVNATQNSNVNPFSGSMQIVVTPYITGNAWYMLAAPSVLPIVMYGYLAGQAGPRLRMDEPFGVQGIRYSVEEDFGTGFIDFRGGFKNAGA